MRTKALLVASALLLIGAVEAGATPGEPVPRQILDIEAECSSLDTLAPERHEVPVVGDYTTQLDLRVHVLAVDVPTDVATLIMDRVKAVFEPLAIRAVPTIEVVDLEVEEPPESGALISASHSQAYIDASKAHFGGSRPPTADVVYTMLGGELASAVAGQADCVGGIAYDDAAFAVGEAQWETDWNLHTSGVIAGHEIAHLLGAHHHFANCAQGNPDDIARFFTPCTLMFNDVGLISLQFATLEGAVVRRWALDYLYKTGEVPPPPPPPEEADQDSIYRRIELSIDGATLSGRIYSVPATKVCTSEVAITLQRKLDKKWKKIAATQTGADGRFSFTLSRPGKYRAKAPLIAVDETKECRLATSEPIAYR